MFLRICPAFAQVGQVAQNIEIIVVSDTGQGFLKAAQDGLIGCFAFPILPELHIQAIYKVNGTDDKVPVPAAYVLSELFRVIRKHAKFKAFADR